MTAEEEQQLWDRYVRYCREDPESAALVDLITPLPAGKAALARVVAEEVEAAAKDDRTWEKPTQGFDSNPYPSVCRTRGPVHALDHIRGRCMKCGELC